MKETFDKVYNFSKKNEMTLRDSCYIYTYLIGGLLFIRKKFLTKSVYFYNLFSLLYLYEKNNNFYIINNTFLLYYF